MFILFRYTHGIEEELLLFVIRTETYRFHIKVFNCFNWKCFEFLNVSQKGLSGKIFLQSSPVKVFVSINYTGKIYVKKFIFSFCLTFRVIMSFANIYFNEYTATAAFEKTNTIFSFKVYFLTRFTFRYITEF